MTGYLTYFLDSECEDVCDDVTLLDGWHLVHLYQHDVGIQHEEGQETNLWGEQCCSHVDQYNVGLWFHLQRLGLELEHV